MIPPPAVVAAPPRGGIRVRWRIFALLFGLGLMVYVQQRSLSVVSYRMMPELGITQMQLGWLEGAFLLGYTALQLPGAVLGQRLGARRMFVLIGAVACFAALVTPLAPWVLHGAQLFGVLLAAQLVLGAAQGPMFPMSSGVFETWFRPENWPLVQGSQSLGLGLGAALTPPLIVGLVSSSGWQMALVWTMLPVLALTALWGWYGRDRPAEHPSVGPAELAELGSHATARIHNAIAWRSLRGLLKNRDVLTLTGAYLCMNGVYYLLGNWCFLYLIQERHFTVLEGGWLASIPPFASALGAGVGGTLATLLWKRIGARWGLRLIPLMSLPAVAVLLLAGVHAANPYLGVAALSLAYFCVELTEGPYWAATMRVAGEDAIAATGILNTGGNIGGLMFTPVIAYLSGHGQWTTAFVLAAVFAVLSGSAWLLVDPDRRTG